MVDQRQNFDVSLEEAVAICKQVLPLMSKQRIPTIPQNYAMWYDYVTRANTELVDEIENLLEQGESFPPARCEDIYHRHYVDSLRTEVNGIQDTIRYRVEDVLRDLGMLDNNISHYSEVLDDCGAKLKADLSQQELNKLILLLAEETQKTRQRSQEVEHSLKSMSGELENLRAEVNALSADSRTDQLTQTRNRRAFDETIKELTVEASSAREPVHLCLMMIDIDHFKQFNDTYGHLVGDEVLRFVALELKACVKGRDTLARYGGEEFALLLPATPYEGGLHLAEQIRAMIEAQPVKNQRGGDPYRITISLGLAEYRTGESVAEFIDRADKALYRAKEQGRNRVCGERDC
ncbi:MAG: GGDEF domain-containing protein [Pseudomonadota bacterium]